jgi:hypothetical protein
MQCRTFSGFLMKQRYFSVKPPVVRYNVHTKFHGNRLTDSETGRERERIHTGKWFHRQGNGLEASRIQAVLCCTRAVLYTCCAVSPEDDLLQCRAESVRQQRRMDRPSVRPSVCQHLFAVPFGYLLGSDEICSSLLPSLYIRS